METLPDRAARGCLSYQYDLRAELLILTVPRGLRASFQAVRCRGGRAGPRGTGGLGRSDPAQSQRAGGTRALLLDSLHLQTRVQQASVKFLNEVKPGAGIFLVPWEHHTVLPGIQLPNKAGP